MEPPDPKEEQPKPPGKTVFAGDLSFFCTEDELLAHFSQIGPVQSVVIRRDEQTGITQMHGFVEMENAADAVEAERVLDGVKFLGRKVR
jgi:RNA recognition motif-containing protein